MAGRRVRYGVADRLGRQVDVSAVPLIEYEKSMRNTVQRSPGWSSASPAIRRLARLIP
jgi:hypothetical protein